MHVVLTVGDSVGFLGILVLHLRRPRRLNTRNLSTLMYAG